jgi:hypothetical protein
MAGGGGGCGMVVVVPVAVVGHCIFIGLKMFVVRQQWRTTVFSSFQNCLSCVKVAAQLRVGRAIICRAPFAVRFLIFVSVLYICEFFAQEKSF